MQKIFFPSSRPTFVDGERIISEIKKVAEGVAKRHKNVENIYLFGSYASGNAGYRSDADVLVVLSEDKRKMKDRLSEFILEFSDVPVPVDVLALTKAELKKARKEKNQFLKRVASGIKLV